MAFDEKLGDRIREAMVDLPQVHEKRMFGGLCFMVHDKMCVGVVKDEMMCRIDPAVYEQALELPGCREMDFNGKPMKGYVFVDEFGRRTQAQFTYWIGLCLDYNQRIKVAKKK